MIDLGTELGVVKKLGNSYAFGENKLGVGRENAKAFLRQNPKIMKDIKKGIVAEAKAKEMEETS
jgi:recombination protein RecA